MPDGQLTSPDLAGGQIEDTTAARLAEIVAAAERAAKQVIDEAEEEARARIADAHEEAERIVAARLAGLADLTDEINAQAEALRRQAEALQQALARAQAEMGGAEALGGSARWAAASPDPAAGTEPTPEPRRPAEPGPDRGRRIHEEPRSDGRPGRAEPSRPPLRDTAHGRRHRAPAPSRTSSEISLGNGSPPGRACWRPRWRSPAPAEPRSRRGCATASRSRTRGAILDAILGPEN